MTDQVRGVADGLVGTPPRRSWRAAKVYLSPWLLRLIMGLPDDLEITAVFVDQDPLGVRVLLSGDRLPPVPEDLETPFCDPPFVVHHKVDEDGVVWQRVLWTGPAETGAQP